MRLVATAIFNFYIMFQPFQKEMRRKRKTLVSKIIFCPS